MASDPSKVLDEIERELRNWAREMFRAAEVARPYSNEVANGNVKLAHLLTRVEALVAIARGAIEVDKIQQWPGGYGVTGKRAYLRDALAKLVEATDG